MSSHRLVYSTDAETNRRCPKCKEVVSECRCATPTSPNIPEKIVAKLSIEKAKRGGKTVTCVRNLPAIDSYLQGLAKEIKTKLGTGGTHGVFENTGFVEIQGDRRNDLRELLQKKGITCKG